MSTPHIKANNGDFAETVVFPGDPLRAKYIAENFFTDAKLVTSVRNTLGYTGVYKGKRLSVMSSGMGIPSASIYATELITKFGVKNLIRLGTAGGLVSANVQLNDIVIALGACTDSNANRIRFNDFDFAATCNYHLLQTVVDTANSSKIKYTVGNVFTSDFFYPSNPQRYEVVSKLGVLCLDMETAGLYGLAHEYKAKAIAIYTISDMVGNSKHTAQLTPEEREQGLNTMITLGLDSAIKL